MASKDLSNAELHLWQVVNANPNKQLECQLSN